MLFLISVSDIKHIFSWLIDTKSIFHDTSLRRVRNDDFKYIYIYIIRYKLDEELLYKFLESFFNNTKFEKKINYIPEIFSID